MDTEPQSTEHRHGPGKRDDPSLCLRGGRVGQGSPAPREGTAALPLRGGGGGGPPGSALRGQGRGA